MSRLMMSKAELKSTNSFLVYVSAWSRRCRMKCSPKLAALSADLFPNKQISGGPAGRHACSYLINSEVSLRATRFGVVSLNAFEALHTRPPQGQRAPHLNPFGHFCSLITEIQLSNRVETKLNGKNNAKLFM
ncbi:hypothetical protein ILYODFUR_020275 [Ilyodon furcidens]|uniref:Uncharacterized protein n=1 Tax=Ilyodon furcidens TaxID=33524 RepID=A0ABV0TAV6_9TELE